MGLFDLFGDVKENMDRRRQAREYLQRAKELVREADNIYEKAYDKVTSYASETEYELRQHADYKKQVAKELGGTISTTLKNFSHFNIDAKTFSSPSIQESNTGLSGFETAMSCFMPLSEMPSIFDMFISDEDYYEAQRQRDEARRYKERMKMEREKLNSYKDKMREIRFFIKSERRELESLTRKLKKMTDELKNGMQKNNFSIDEAQYLKGIHKIAECVVTLLSTNFLNDTFSINQRYQKVFSNIENINENLPYAPSITDPDTVTAIKNILDSTILY